MRVWIETCCNDIHEKRDEVTLRVRVWIETSRALKASSGEVVTLRVRVWIETQGSQLRCGRALSHPPREGVD